jgi:uncharacterized protein (DUF58 family)
VLAIRPEKRMLLTVALWTGIGLAAARWESAADLWRFLGVLIGALAGADLLLLLRLPAPRIERRLRHTIPLGVWSRVSLDVVNDSGRRLLFALHDLHPPAFEVQGLPRALAAQPRQTVGVDYRMRPPRRGDFELPGCDLRLTSPLGFWHRSRRVAVRSRIRVFPNFAEISRYTLLATEDRLGALGVRVRPRRGSGAEFHQLREYRLGDSLRQIDWKATSRIRKLVSREYQDERDQRLVFLLDCGRRMRHADTGRGHLDEALNALLLLAYVAVRQGDAVGLMTFGGPRRWFAPRKEPDTVNRLLNAVYDLQPTLEAADPLTAGRELLQSTQRRALVVMLTNTRDEDGPELQTAIRLLSRRHLVVLADLRESALDQTLATPVSDWKSALRFHAVQDYLDVRRRHHERLHHSGAQVLDLIPSQLPIALVNRYLEIKRAAVL